LFLSLFAMYPPTATPAAAEHSQDRRHKQVASDHLQAGAPK
jgi:hypothetical protein